MELPHDNNRKENSVQILLPALFLILTAMITACGGGELPEPAEESGSPDSLLNSATSEQTVTTPEVFYPDGTLDPSTVTVGVPVSAVALYEAYFAWNGRYVILQGYPYVFYGESITVTDELEMVAAAGGREILATVAFQPTLNLVLSATEPVTVAGTIMYNRSGEIELTEGEILYDKPAAEAGIRLSPYLRDSTSAVGIGEFYEQFNIWIGTEVTVEGYYNSITTSTLSDRVVVRVDLSDPAETCSKKATCEMTGEIPDSISAVMGNSRAGTQIRGTVSGESFGMVGLENCELVNR